MKRGKRSNLGELIQGKWVIEVYIDIIDYPIDTGNIFFAGALFNRMHTNKSGCYDSVGFDSRLPLTVDVGKLWLNFPQNGFILFDHLFTK